jgi:hypothetical protein
VPVQVLQRFSSAARVAALSAALIVSSTLFVSTASAANRAPVISGTPPSTATVGKAYYFRPTASDPDGNTLRFSIARKPAWASFDAVTGSLSGTPKAADVGYSQYITISVTDGIATTSLPRFRIKVQAGGTNRAPTISGIPPGTAIVSQPYSFRPTASDADGDPLTFSIQNRPGWATFDTATGLLYGKPSSSNVGRFTNIAISVSDGKTSASLPAFTIVVEYGSTTSVTVSWKPPTTNTDGTPISGLSGYRLSYGTAPGQYSQSVSIADPRVTSAVIEGLGPATWYFAAKAVTSSGVESAYSAEVKKTVP